MATEAGIKRHITQSSACRDQWLKVLECLKFTVSDDEDNQPPAQMDDDAPDYPYDWEDAFDGMDGPDVGLDVPDGHLVHQTRVDVDPGPPDLSKPPSKQARVEADEEHLPRWPSSERFTEQYAGVAATILDKRQTVFEFLEAAGLEEGESEWTPFHDEDEWDLARFLMKDLGQKKIDELLKLSHVSE